VRIKRGIPEDPCAVEEGSYMILGIKRRIFGVKMINLCG
jgi:hypothetical protein